MSVILTTDCVERLHKAKYKKFTVTIYLDDRENFGFDFNCDGEADLSLSYRDWLKVSEAMKRLGVLEYLDRCSNIGKHGRRILDIELGTAPRGKK